MRVENNLRILLALMVFGASAPNVSHAQGNEGSECQFTNGTSGTCTKIVHCPGVDIRNISGSVLQCSFVQTMPIICCANSQAPSPARRPRPVGLEAESPETNSSWISPAENIIVDDDNCVLENGDQGKCKNSRDCPRLRDIISSGKQPKTCSFNQLEPVICCPINRNQPIASIRSPVLSTQRTPPNNAYESRTTRRTTAMPTRSVGDLANAQCEYYSQFVYQMIQAPILMVNAGRYNESQCIAQQSQHNQEPIMESEEAKMKEFPHMAALGYGDEDNVEFLCSGSLISERFILTTAHCLSSPQRGKVRWARMGDRSPRVSSGEQVTNKKVDQRLQHPSGDIALLRLENSLKFSGYVRPACLYTQAGNPLGHRFATATGWGKTDWNDTTTSTNLMKKDLNLQTQCSSSTQSHGEEEKMQLPRVDGDVICTSNPNTGDNVCVGDSGGPLQILLQRPFCMHSILGLTTSGPRACGMQSRPAHYVRVSNYISWIESNVWTL